MNIACCQLDIAWVDKPVNYRRVEAMVAGAAIPQGTLLLLPEMFATGFTMSAEAVAEPDDGPTAQFLSGLARRNGIYVQAGLVIAGGDAGRPQNVAAIFDPSGQRVAQYAKIHLFSYAGEPASYRPGDAPLVVPVQEAILAPVICYDLRFPELFRAVVQLGAELITVIACWPEARQSHWLALLQARAIENQCYVAAVNRCGREPFGLTYSGRSQIIDPRGEVLADAGTGETVIQASADFDGLRAYRASFPALGDIRLR